MATPPKANQPKMVTSAVARGRTVIAGEPPRHHGPGSLVTLPEEEAHRLIEAGFLADPNTPALPLGTGPVYRPEDPNPNMITETENDGG